MTFSETDKKRHTQLGALLKKAKFELNIDEMMAGAQAYSWLAQLPHNFSQVPVMPQAAKAEAPKEEEVNNVSNSNKRRPK